MLTFDDEIEQMEKDEPMLQYHYIKNLIKQTEVKIHNSVKKGSSKSGDEYISLLEGRIVRLKLDLKTFEDKHVEYFI